MKSIFGIKTSPPHTSRRSPPVTPPPLVLSSIFPPKNDLVPPDSVHDADTTEPSHSFLHLDASEVSIYDHHDTSTSLTPAIPSRQLPHLHPSLLVASIDMYDETASPHLNNFLLDDSFMPPPSSYVSPSTITPHAPLPSFVCSTDSSTSTFQDPLPIISPSTSYPYLPVAPATSFLKHTTSTYFPTVDARSNVVSPLVSPGTSTVDAVSIPSQDAAMQSTPQLQKAPQSAPEPRYRRKKMCTYEGCPNQARMFQRCKKHGGFKRCTVLNCSNTVQSRGLCIRHGGGRRCQVSGCVNSAQSKGRCKLHGGGRMCRVETCEKKAHLNRLCRQHGGGIKCSVRGCEKWAQNRGMCVSHAKEATTS